MHKRGSAELDSAGLFFLNRKKGSAENSSAGLFSSRKKGMVWSEVVTIIIILIIILAIAYGLWKILPK